MALIKCPECGRENVSDSAKACPGCGFQISAHFRKIENKTYTDNSLQSLENDVQKEPNNKGVIVTVIVVLAIITIMGLSIWRNWYSSTRCEWSSGCTERKTSSGSFCTYHEDYLTSYARSYVANYDSRSEYDLIITKVSVTTNSASTYCTGTITNTGDKSFKFVKVKGAFKDSNGNTIETGDAYAVGSEGLAPGESTSFTIRCTKNSKVKSCTVTVYSYD